MVRTLYSVYAAGPEHKSHPVALLLFFYGRHHLGVVHEINVGGSGSRFSLLVYESDDLGSHIKPETGFKVDSPRL